MWLYQGKEFKLEISDYVGFVYLITNLQTNRKYVGRKFFTKAASKQVKGKKKKFRKESDWIDYYGSSKELQEEIKLLGKDNYKREILHLCKTKGDCSWFEAKEIINRDALRSADYYNVWCSIKIRDCHLSSFII